MSSATAWYSGINKIDKEGDRISAIALYFYGPFLNTPCSKKDRGKMKKRWSQIATTSLCIFYKKVKVI
jgi:hypothetical protein